MITALLGGLQIHARFDDFDPVSRSHVCQKRNCKLCFIRFLPTVV